MKLSRNLSFYVVVCMNDLDLVQKCQNGETQYFGELYDKYIDKIYKFTYMKTSNKEVAEDIVSDTFYSALNKISSMKVEDGSSFQSWIYTIAYNKVKDFYRQNKENVSLEDIFEQGEESDFAKSIDDKESVKQAFEFLHTLKDEHREIIILRIWDDLSYKEISEITGKSIDNCKKIVSRTLKTINANFIMVLLMIILL